MKLRDKSIEALKPEVLDVALKHFQKQQQVRQAIITELEALRPNFGVGALEKVRAHIQFFTDALAANYEFELTDSGDVLLFRDGARVENRQGYPLSLAQVVRQEAEARYELFAKDSPVGGGPDTPLRFKDANDYMSRWRGAKNLEERQALVAAWQAQQSGK